MIVLQQVWVYVYLSNFVAIVCVCVFMCAYVPVWVCVCVRARTHKCVCVCVSVHLCALSQPLLTRATSNIKRWLGSEMDHIQQKRLNPNSSCGGSWRTNSLFMAGLWTQTEKKQLQLTFLFYFYFPMYLQEKIPFLRQDLRSRCWNGTLGLFSCFSSLCLYYRQSYKVVQNVFTFH